MRTHHRLFDAIRRPMRSLRVTALALLPLALLVASGCESPMEPAPTTPPFEDFKQSDFDPTSQDISNSWMGFVPGTRFVYEGFTVEEGVDVPHRVEINITHMTKEINGVTARVAYDLDYSDGQLVEAELAFYAEDKFGNVWRMGEYPEEYEYEDDGTRVIAAAPTWLQGIQDAVAGISMLASPQLGDNYSQGWSTAVGFTDRGTVDQMNQTVTANSVVYNGVLVIAESATGEPGEQLKYWAPGVGNVLVGFRGAGEQTRERLDLTEVLTLDAAALETIRVDACSLEASALRESPDVYGRAPRLQLASGGPACQ